MELMERKNIHLTELGLSGSESLERRRQIRFGLRAPVHFTWADRDGVVHKGDGFSRDISSHGVYVYTEGGTQPQRDADIEVDILLHSFSESHHLHMRGRARVVRVEPVPSEERPGGFVAQSDSYVFQEGENPTGEA
jgi:hypothetical protein